MSRKGLTELVMILDRSGSMSGLESDTIGGFNSMIEKQKKRTARHTYPLFFLTIRRMSSMTASICATSSP